MIHRARVIPGRGEGRKLGFPTLNMEVPPGFEAKHGIYAGWVWIGDERAPAAFHYGPVPAFGIEKVSLEAHVIGKDIPLPPPDVRFEMTEFLREIKPFPVLAELKDQLRKDVEQAKKMLESV